MAHIKTIDDLRKIYDLPKGRPVDKILHKLEQHSRQFISLSPFFVISSVGKDGHMDASPRGENPGFVRVLDDTTLAISDRPGNNRLDTLSNLIDVPCVGLVFLIPGVNEVLRINGIAEIRSDKKLVDLFNMKGRVPATVLIVKIEELYLHCAKAIMRSHLWDEDAKIERGVLPTMGKMINDQLSVDDPAETQKEMDERYKKILY